MKRMSEKSSLKIGKGLLYPMPGPDLKPCRVGRKFLLLQPMGRIWLQLAWGNLLPDIISEAGTSDFINVNSTNRNFPT
jgi:hypothetical protein